MNPVDLLGRGVAVVLAAVVVCSLIDLARSAWRHL
jgi:hypothetical protein